MDRARIHEGIRRMRFRDILGRPERSELSLARNFVFTHLAGPLLSQAIGTWFLRVGQIAQQQGSWAQKYIGDAMMAVWVHSGETALGSDLACAMRAVSEIADATGAIHLALPLPAPLRIGAGVNTGPAIVGGVDYTALGDTVNAAFRLEAATKQLGMGVALGERTFCGLSAAMQRRFVQRSVTLKGYEGESTAWGISFEDLRGAL